MTNREREFAELGLEYAEGIDRADVVRLPTGREVRKTKRGWETQPVGDNYWLNFDDLLDAVKCGLGKITQAEARERAKK